MREIYVVGLITILLMVLTIVLTYTSRLDRDKKIPLYITSVFAPPVAIILFLIFYFKDKGAVAKT